MSAPSYLYVTIINLPHTASAISTRLFVRKPTVNYKLATLDLYNSMLKRRTGNLENEEGTTYAQYYLKPRGGFHLQGLYNNAGPCGELQSFAPDKCQKAKGVRQAYPSSAALLYSI